jgi:methyl-accepting chemotaxis protein
MRMNENDEALLPKARAGLLAPKDAEYRRRGLTRTLCVGVTIPFAASMLVMLLVAVLAMRATVDRLVGATAKRALASAESTLESELRGSMVGFLEAKAESARDLFSAFDDRAARGQMSKAQAFASARQALASPAFGSWEGSGYYAAVDGRGFWPLHPPARGGDADKLAFVQAARSLGEGFLEYRFQAPGDATAREKAAYVTRYAPRDLLVWAVVDEAEYLGRLDPARLDAWIRPQGDKESGDFFLLDAAGKLVLGRDRYGLASAAAATSAAALTAPNARDPKVAKAPAAAQYVSTGGSHLRLDSIRLPEGPWTLVSVTQLGPYDALVAAVAAIMAAALVLAGAAINLALRVLLARHLKPIREMQAVADKVSSGDLTGRIEENADDEIGEVSWMFNRVMDEFADLLRKVKAMMAVLGGSIQNLSTSTQEIASTSNEQAASVKEVLSTMEDSDRLSKGVETKIQEVARIATHTKDNVERGFELIQSSLGKMEEIRSTNAQTLVGIKTLGDLIETIWDIVNIINGIADQTKIIAFNAELEAAAAGDAGKNFRIVAGEIRRLADSTVDSTNEIKEKINEIQHASDKLILASEEGTQRIREGWDVSSNIRGVFEDVLRSSEISANSANDISRSINMQVVSFEQIFLTLKQISESIDNFVESTSYTTEVSDKLKSISESFRAQVESYSIDEAGTGRRGGS